MSRIVYSHYYSKWHSDDQAHEEEMFRYYSAWVQSDLPEDRNVQTLDIGCGMGFALRFLQRQGFHNIAGIDMDRGQVESCRKKGLKVTQESDSTAYLLKHPNEYDLIFLFDVLEHIPPSAHMDFMRALVNSLKPCGKLILTAPNANSVLAARWRYNDWTHHTSFTEHSLDFVLKNAGFRNIQIGEQDFIKKPRLFWIPVISGSRHWWLLRFFRFWRYLEVRAELGRVQARSVPLTLNLKAVAIKEK